MFAFIFSLSYLMSRLVMVGCFAGMDHWLFSLAYDVFQYSNTYDGKSGQHTLCHRCRGPCKTHGFVLEATCCWSLGCHYFELFATKPSTSITIANAGTVYWVTSSFQLTHPEDGDKNLRWNVGRQHMKWLNPRSWHYILKQATKT